MALQSLKNTALDVDIISAEIRIYNWGEGGFAALEIKVSTVTDC